MVVEISMLLSCSYADAELIFSENVRCTSLVKSYLPETKEGFVLSIRTFELSVRSFCVNVRIDPFSVSTFIANVAKPSNTFAGTTVLIVTFLSVDTG